MLPGLGHNGGPALWRRGPTDSDIATWVDTVVTNSGTVSSARAAQYSDTARAMKDIGTWQLADDLLFLMGENAPQALTSWKQRRLATAVGSPTFAADQPYTLNGSSQYINTGFIPSTHAVGMTGSSVRLASVDTVNVQSPYALGDYNNTSTQGFRFLPRNGSNFMVAQLNATQTTGAVPLTSSVGLRTATRSGSTYSFSANGELVETFSPASNGTSLPTVAIYVGATNNNGTPASYGTRSIGFVSFGAPVSAAQDLGEYNALKAHMAGLGVTI